MPSDHRKLWSAGGGEHEVSEDEFRALGLDSPDEGGHHNEGPFLRLLRCTVCKSVEELPDYQGDPRNDVMLDHLVMDHQRRHPTRDEASAFLMRVSQFDWEHHKKAIYKQIWSDLETTGFIPEYYDTKSTFNEDAAKCFKAHRRSIPCIDWHSDGKRIGNPTKEGWRSGARVYLCDFCPVAQAVQSAKNKARGIE